MIASHAVLATAALLLGPVNILRRRRDRAHRILGITWVALIGGVCLTSFGIHPHGFTWLHGLALWTLLCMVLGVMGIVHGQVHLHRGMMVGSYVGTVIAFLFATVIPERLIPTMLREEPLTIVATVAAVGATCAVWVVAVLRTSRRRPARRPVTVGPAAL